MPFLNILSLLLGIVFTFGLTHGVRNAPSKISFLSCLDFRLAMDKDASIVMYIAVNQDTWHWNLQFTQSL